MCARMGARDTFDVDGVPTHWQIYAQVNSKFDVTLDKAQRRLVKAHVLELVRMRNAGEGSGSD